MIKEKFFCKIVYDIRDDRVEYRNEGYVCHLNATFRLNEFGTAVVYYTWGLNIWT